MDKLSTLYGDAYLERMAQKREVVWWERFATYERLYGNWKGLIAGNVIDVDQAYDQFLRLQIAYYRLENRQNVVLGGGPNPLIAQIWSDMKAQFKRWDGTLTNRGAWWGSPGPGIVTGAIDIPTDVLHELVIKANASSSWRVEPSWSGGIGFHRTYNNIDFIYHAKKP